MESLHDKILSSEYVCRSTIIKDIVYQIARFTNYARNDWSGEQMVKKFGNRDIIELSGVNNEPVVEYRLYHTSIVTIIGTVVYVNDSDNFSFSGSATTRNRRVCVPLKLMRQYSFMYSEIRSYEQLPEAYR